MSLPNTYAVLSAQIYRQYLLDTRGGQIVIPVKSKSTDGTFFDLELAEKPRMWDSLKVEIAGTVYEYGQIYLVSYDVASRKLKVSPDDIRKNLLTTEPVGNIKLVSDLTFLVKRVEDWYQNSQNVPCIPQTFTPIPEPDLSLLEPELETNQIDAILGALKEPFSYIWGPPGTGKTQMVLARCIWAYLKENKRVLIAAPTNNALEQTLYGVLAVLRNAGIDFHNKIVRLGVPSSEFAGTYPEVCESLDYINKVKELTGEIENVKGILVNQKKIAGQIPEYKAFCKNLAAFRACSDDVLQYADDLKRSREERGAANREAAKYEAEVRSRKWKLEPLRKSKDSLGGKLLGVNDEISKIENSLFKAFRSKKLKNLYHQQQVILGEVNHIEKEEAPICAELQEFQSLLEASKQKRETAGYNFRMTENAIDKCTEIFPDLHEKCCQQMKHPLFDIGGLEEIVADFKRQFAQQEIQFADYNEHTEEEANAAISRLTDRLTELQAELNALMAANDPINNADCKVIAATVDTCIARITPNGEPGFDHVFLDEAGYCPLIKGAVLTAYHCPVTFLGDHMQLPPVCEMDIKDIDTPGHKPVFLWAQSALYVDQALSKHLSITYDTFIHNEEPPQIAMQKYNLLHSYRFGIALANALSGVVYPQGFQGNPAVVTNVECISTHRTHTDLLRACKDEQEKIVAYCSKHIGENIGIITPYKDQRDAIKEKLKEAGLPYDNVMTVHASQGREWDTVLFSVVDTHAMWFTDSDNQLSKGKNVVNTAVSRAKNKLIIVCDDSFWKLKHEQLIGRLL